MATGGVYNFVTKRGKAQGRGSKISWTQVETGLGNHVEVPQASFFKVTTRSASSTPWR